MAVGIIQIFLMSLCPLRFITRAGLGRGRKWDQCHIPGPSCFPAPLPVPLSFPYATSPCQVSGTWYSSQVTWGHLCIWGHVASAAWARVKPEHFSQQSLGQGLTCTAGDRPQNSQLRPASWAGIRVVTGSAEPLAEMSGRELARCHVVLLLSSAVLPFCNLWISFRAKAWGPSLREIRPWSQIVWTEVSKPFFKAQPGSPRVNLPLSFCLTIPQQMAFDAVSVCNCSFWCVSHNEP